MVEGFFTILNIQEIWESITLKVNSLFDPEKFQFLDALEIFWGKILDNPLASIITILVLIGLPYTLFKAKESNTQANERLDRLMEEMKDFEFEKPLIDLQDKFKDISIDNSLITTYDQDVAELNLENVVPDLSIEEDPVLKGFESASFKKQLTLDQEVTDDFLATGPMDLEMETEDETPDLPPAAEEIFDETEVGQPEPSIENENFVDQYFKDLHKRDEDRDLVFATDGNFDETQITQPVESSDEDEKYASHDIDDLQTRMEQAIKKLRLNYPSPEETEETASHKTNTESAPSVLEVVKIPSNEETEEENNDPSPPSSETGPLEEDASSPSPESTPADSPAGTQENSLKKSDLITHLKSFQKNLENRFDSQNNETKQNSSESQQEKNSSFNRILKTTGITSPAPNKTTDNENQESLESFIFLKDQNRPD